ncbi:hypothetical protein [Sphingobium bisphenolivorans]|uniref:hypothetical protein n=1 Tax=Sphingobium bisphenolivorans TaxID=1335760 RepID=UPI0003A669C1|nr:hypothetical protein [Sphingobium bisphenolivorans]
MKFLSKLLTKKEEGPATVSRAEYHRMEDALNARIQACHTAIADMRRERDFARAKAASYRADAEKYRRSRSNLKQFRDQKAVANG